MATKTNNIKKRRKDYNDKSIRSIDKNLDNSKVFDTKKISGAKHGSDSSLDKTNIEEFHFDDTMLDDFDSLDVSFVDSGNKKKKARKELKKRNINKKIKVKRVRFRSMNFVVFLILILLSIVLGGILTYIGFYDKFTQTKIVTKVEEKKVVDDNYVFVGDSLFAQYNLREFFEGERVVNSGIDGNTTSDILFDMNYRIYRYNPSKVFLLVGTNDIKKDKSEEDIVENIGEIIDGIKNNRKLADIYLLSLLPVNKNKEEDKVDLDMIGRRTNSIIKSINKKLEELAEDKKINYIDAYDPLTDGNGDLEIDYTKEGLHLNEDGYSALTKVIKRSLKD
ncbi:MAG: hypothetical protein IJI43_03215 [Bacilli bacterium]|nr:hypothetical protein [Bacilli bacterium]